MSDNISSTASMRGRIPSLKRSPRSRWLKKIQAASLLAFLPGAPLWAATVYVPADFTSIQAAIEAVQSDLTPGEVVINSNDVFEESVYIRQSLTLRAGNGFRPKLWRDAWGGTVLRINTNADTDTTINIRGMDIEADNRKEENVYGGVYVSNADSAGRLFVNMNDVGVQAWNLQSAVSVAAATIAGDIQLNILNSRLEVIGDNAGSPECLRLDPLGYSLTVFFTASQCRFSNAGGISVQTGHNDKTISVFINQSYFEGYTSAAGSPRAALHIGGNGSAGTSDESATSVLFRNNLVENAGAGVRVVGQQLHTHTLTAFNNTIVNSADDAIALHANSADSTINAAVSNNIIIGSGGFGIAVGAPPSSNNEPLNAAADSMLDYLTSGILNLTASNNLYRGNVLGDYYAVAPGGGDITGANPLLLPVADYGGTTPSRALATGSPAIDAGDASKCNSQDQRFFDRPEDGDGDGVKRCDIGAFEVQAGEAYDYVSEARNDFNADGSSDILWRNGTSGGTSIWLVNGLNIAGASSLGSVPGDWIAAGTGDFDNDGTADIVWRNQVTGKANIWLLENASVTANGNLGVIATDFEVAGTGDFNGDGKSDLLWRNGISGGTSIWFVNGLTISGTASLGSVPGDWIVAGIGDFNGDGSSDIVWRNQVTGKANIWLLSNGTVVGNGNLGVIGTNFSVAGTGDFNGDGKSDILWRNGGTGGTSIWFVNGLNITGTASLGSVPSDWIVATTGDYNGDGTSDLLWRNQVTGKTNIWLLANGVVTENGNLGVISTDFSVVP